MRLSRTYLCTKFNYYFIFKLKNSFIQLINNVVLVSGAQQSGSVTHVRMSILPQILLHLGY